MPHLCYSTLGCPDWDLAAIARGARSCGFDGVELRVADDGVHLRPDATAEALAHVREIFAEEGVPIVSLAAYPQFSARTPEQVAALTALTRQVLGVASALGARWIRTYGGAIDQEVEDHERASERIADLLRPLAAEAAALGVTICLETHSTWADGQDMARIQRKLDGQPGAGVLFDICNTLDATGGWRPTYELLRERICYYHVKDAYQDANGKHHHMLIGAGDVPLGEILATLKAEQPDCWLSFEWEKRWEPALEPPERAFPQFVHKMRRLWAEA